MSRRKLAAVVSAGVLMVVTIFGIVWVSGFGRHDNTLAPTVSGAHSTDAPKQELDAENVKFLEASLNSPAKDNQAKALVPALRSGTWSNTLLLPEGSMLTIDRATFEASDALATVIAMVTGAIRGTFRLYLVVESGRWLICATERA